MSADRHCVQCPSAKPLPGAVRGRLFSPVELFDKAALSHFVDEAQLHHLFRFDFGGARIGQGLHFQRLLQPFDGRIGVFDEQLGVGGMSAFQDLARQTAGVLWP